MVFGTFDLLHAGHVHFLAEAKKCADKLIVALAPDSVVLRLKGRPPRNPFSKRQENLNRLGLADDVVMGDEISGSWNVLGSFAPDNIALGYDQKELAEELKKFFVKNPKPVRLVYIGPHAGGVLHSSVLRDKVIK